jgi:hypothetical protein
MNKTSASKILPGHEHIPDLDDYDLPAHIEIDYRKAKPNRFVGRVKFTHGGAWKGAGRKRSAEPTECHTITLSRADADKLRAVDPSLSRHSKNRRGTAALGLASARRHYKKATHSFGLSLFIAFLSPFLIEGLSIRFKRNCLRSGERSSGGSLAYYYRD